MLPTEAVIRRRAAGQAGENGDISPHRQQKPPIYCLKSLTSRKTENTARILLIT